MEEGGARSVPRHAHPALGASLEEASVVGWDCRSGGGGFGGLVVCWDFDLGSAEGETPVRLCSGEEGFLGVSGSVSFGNF